MNALLEGARSNVSMLRSAVTLDPNNAQYKRMLAEAEAAVKAAEQLAGSPIAQVQQAPTGPTLEQRVSQLEQLVQAGATAAVDEAAKAGMAVMSAIGQSMTPEQAQFVQERLGTSPQFFASESAQAAIGIFIEEWRAFEGAKK